MIKDIKFVISKYFKYWDLLPWIDLTKIKWDSIIENVWMEGIIHPVLAKVIITRLSDHFSSVGSPCLENDLTFRIIKDRTTLYYSLLPKATEGDCGGTFIFMLINEDITTRYIHVVQKLSGSRYRESLKYLEKYHSKYIYWRGISRNRCNYAIEMLRNNKEKINWDELSSNNNAGAVELLSANVKNINWIVLSGNCSDGAIDILKNHPDKINWDIVVRKLQRWCN